MAVMEFSRFGERFRTPSGILRLMDDLGRAMAGGDMLMLGGGNPAAIPEMQAVWRRRVRELLDDGAALDRTLLHYDTPRGNVEFLATLAAFFRREFGWPVEPGNLVVTAGAQSAFFALFNMLAGDPAPGRRRRRIVLPLMPEYIGYADQGLSPDLFRGLAPRVESTGPHRFKYHVDFAALDGVDDAAAVCVSRPTNPTGNVLPDDEVSRLRDFARARGVPLIVDNAYGAPFPGILFRNATPTWDPDSVRVFSLSKLGLPGVRTGIVLAPLPLADALASWNSILHLANDNVGQAIVRPLFESGEILQLSREVIRPFYEARSRQALAWADELLGGAGGWTVHESEGALFLWFRFPGLKIRSGELYERLKRRGVLVVPGQYFFYGGQEEHPHAHECLRVTCSQAPETVREGFRILAEEVRRAARDG
jgi:valine--pyruvate aminotransferase